MKKFLLAVTVVSLLTQPALAEIKFGWAGPITGSAASVGEKNRLGAKQAVDDINARGGILGQAVSIQFEDDAGDPKQAVSVANRLVANGAQFVVGHQNSGASIPASEAYADAGVLMITPASTNPTLTENGLWNVFRVCGRDDQQGAVAGKHLAKAFAGKKIFIVNDKTPYGVGLSDEVKKAMNQDGLIEVGYEGITAGEKDYSALVSRIKNSGADAVYFGGFFTEAGLIIRQLSDVSVHIPFFGGDALFSSELLAIAGPGAEGTMITWGPDATKNEAAADVVQRFREHNIEPEGLTLYGYAAVQVLASAIEAAGKSEPEMVAEKLHSGSTFNTVIGPLSFNEKGDPTRVDFVFYKQTNGKFIAEPQR